MGREDPYTGVFPDVDLTPHGAEEGGVSRRHFKITFSGGQYLVEDLNSTNFTFVNNQRLAPGAPLALVVTYHSDQRRPRSFEILIDGRKIADERLEASSRARFFDVEYPIPPDRLAGRTTITVRFQAAEGSEVPSVFGVRVIRKSPS